MQGMMLPGEFVQVYRTTPWRQRPSEWWETFSFIVSVIIAVVSPLIISILFPADGFDIVALILIIIVSYLFIKYGYQFDKLVIPLQPPFQNIPGRVLVAIGLFLPFITAFVINAYSGISSYTLIIVNAIIGTLIASLFLKIPHSVHGRSKPLPSGVHVCIAWLIFSVVCITRVSASSPLMMSSSVCPTSIAVAGIIVSGLSATLNAPSILHKLYDTGGGPYSGATAVITGKPALDLLSRNGLAHYDQGIQGFLMAPAFAGWLNRPGSDALPITEGNVIGEARDKTTGAVTPPGSMHVSSIHGASVPLHQNGAIQADHLSLVVSHVKSTAMQPVYQASSIPTPGHTGGHVQGGVGPSKGVDLKTTEIALDIAGQSVQTTVDYAGNLYAAGGKDATAGAVKGGATSTPPATITTSEQQASFCRHCGSPVSPDSVFCGRCGKDVRIKPVIPGEQGAPAKRTASSPGSSSSSTTLYGAAAGPVGGQGGAVQPPEGVDLKTTETALDIAGQSVQTTVDYAGNIYAAGAKDATADAVKGGATSTPPAAITTTEQQASFCRHCGAKVAPETKFCNQCGREVKRTIPSGSPPTVCSRCKASLIPGKKYCPTCGMSVSQMQTKKSCPQCGSEAFPGSTFCRKCGKKLV